MPPKVRSTGLDHVQLAMPVGGKVAARQFYGKFLGLTEVAKPEALLSRGGCWFEGANTNIHLAVLPEFTPASKAHHAFLVSDLEDMRRKLQSGGVHIVHDGTLKRVRRFYSNDPFGNRLEFIQGGDGFSQQASQSDRSTKE